MDVEQRARELLAAELDDYWAKRLYEGLGFTVSTRQAMDAIAAALTQPDGSDQSLLELAATFETCIPFLPSAGQRNIGKAVAQLRHMAMGYVLVPVELMDEIENLALIYEAGGDVDCSISRLEAFLTPIPEKWL